MSNVLAGRAVARILIIIIADCLYNTFGCIVVLAVPCIESATINVFCLSIAGRRALRLFTVQHSENVHEQKWRLIKESVTAQLKSFAHVILVSQ